MHTMRAMHEDVTHRRFTAVCQLNLVSPDPSQSVVILSRRPVPRKTCLRSDFILPDTAHFRLVLRAQSPHPARPQWLPTTNPLLTLPCLPHTPFLSFPAPPSLPLFPHFSYTCLQYSCTISSYTGFARRDDAHDVMSGLHHNAQL